MTWIPVSERLPDDGCFILATNGIDVEIGQVRRLPDGSLEYVPDLESSIVGDIDTITHWQPLPEAPTKD